MTNEELLNQIEFEKKWLLDAGLNIYNLDIAFDAIISAVKETALEAQPTDAVSREAVIRLVEQYPSIIGNRCSGLIADIKHLPSVTPERPKGKWIEDTQTGFKIRCSECGARNFGADRAYCPRCGRQMKEDSDD